MAVPITSTSAFVVTLAASIGFLTALGFAGIQWQIVVGPLVGGLIVLTNSRALLNADLIDVPGGVAIASYAAIAQSGPTPSVTRGVPTRPTRWSSTRCATRSGPATAYDDRRGSRPNRGGSRTGVSGAPRGSEIQVTTLGPIQYVHGFTRASVPRKSPSTRPREPTRTLKDFRDDCND